MNRRRTLTGRTRRLSTEVDEVGTEMELCEWHESGGELRGAARMVREWAGGEEADIGEDSDDLR